MVVRIPLEDVILVRIQAPQQTSPIVDLAPRKDYNP